MATIIGATRMLKYKRAKAKRSKASGGYKRRNEELPFIGYGSTRNRAIVDSCDVLAACPKGPEEQRSGTWATVRFARKQGKRIVIFWPDGSVTEEAAGG